MRLGQVRTRGAVNVDLLNEAELVVSTTGEILKTRFGGSSQKVLVVDTVGNIINDYSWFKSKFKGISDKELEDEVKRRGLSW